MASGPMAQSINQSIFISGTCPIQSREDRQKVLTREDRQKIFTTNIRRPI